MLSRRQLECQPDPNFIVRAPSRSVLAYAPTLAPLPATLHKWLVERQLLSSRDGRDVAEVVRASGNSLLVTHADPSVPPQPFDAVLLLHVGPASIRLWGGAKAFAAYGR